MPFGPGGPTEGGRVYSKPANQPVAQVKNFVKGIEQMAATRLQVCHGCEYWDRTFKRCKKCGCFTSAKARIPSARCPINKWPAQ